MRRIVIIGTAVAVLVGAAAAFAAFNNYAGSHVSFAPGGAGSARHPKTVNMTEVLKASAPAGDRAAPLVDIKLKVYGVKTLGNKFPTCTDSQIEADKTKYEQACAHKSEVAAGPVHALLGPGSDPSQSKGTNCNPYLKVFNAGKSKQAFFFTTTTHTPNPAAYTCAGLPTGATAPYDGHISYSGKWWIINVPLPPDISNKVANTPGLYGSLITETLSPIAASKGYMQSIACKGHSRPFSITFTADDYNTGKPETQTVTGRAAC